MIEELKVELKNNKYSLAILSHYEVINYNEEKDFATIEFELEEGYDFSKIYRNSVDSKFGGTISEFIQNDFKDLVRADLMLFFKKNYQITNFICDINNSIKVVDKFEVYINFIERKAQ